MPPQREGVYQTQCSVAIETCKPSSAESVNTRLVIAYYPAIQTRNICVLIVAFNCVCTQRMQDGFRFGESLTENMLTLALPKPSFQIGPIIPACQAHAKIQSEATDKTQIYTESRLKKQQWCRKLPSQSVQIKFQGSVYLWLQVEV